MLTDQEKAKIRQEAEALYPMPYPNLTSKGEGVDPLWNFYDNKNIQAGCMRESHIAAVTAERERAKGIEQENAELRKRLAELCEAYNKLSEQATIWREESGN